MWQKEVAGALLALGQPPRAPDGPAGARRKPNVLYPPGLMDPQGRLTPEIGPGVP